MANSFGVSTSFKTELLTGTHVLGTDTLKMALYLATASIAPSTTVYTATGEITPTGYTAGGVAITNVAPASGSFSPTVALSYPITAASGTFDCALLYNTSKTNKCIAVFGLGNQAVTGTFTLTMPANLLTVA